MNIIKTIKKEKNKHFIEKIEFEITANNCDIDLTFGDIGQDGQELLKNILSIQEALELAYYAGKNGEDLDIIVKEE